MAKTTLLILAAGIGKRYGGLKQMDTIGPSGEVMMDYSIYDAMRAGFDKVVFIIRKDIENEFKSLYAKKLDGKIEYDFVNQDFDKLPGSFNKMDVSHREKPWGTGHALWCAKEAINEPFIVINADDFYGKNAFETIYEQIHNSSPRLAFMVGYYLKNTLSEHGTVSRGVCRTNEEGYLKYVKECTRIARNSNGTITFLENEKENELPEDSVVSMNFWGFHPSMFQYHEEYLLEFLQENASDPKKEFYIPFVVNELIQKHSIKVQVLESTAQWFGMTYKEEKQVVQQRIKQLVDQNVYPEDMWA